MWEEGTKWASITAPGGLLWTLLLTHCFGIWELQTVATLHSFSTPPHPRTLARLVLRRLYPLAIQICEYLRLPEVQGVSRILAHWACYKVRI